MIGKRGGSRPGAGRKPGKVSTAKRTIAEAAQKHAASALNVLVDIAKDTSAPSGTRVNAANAILDRAYGKPVPIDPEPPRDHLTECIMEINRRGSAIPIGNSGRPKV